MISLQMLYVFVVERGCKHFLAAHRYFAVLLEVGQKQKKKEKKSDGYFDTTVHVLTFILILYLFLQLVTLIFE